LEWQREKAGTIEALRDVLKNELAAGVMPCGRFGANAVWLRLAVMTYNVMTAPKRLAMPEKWLTARPKRMRFQIFCSHGKLVSHARQTGLRVRRLKEQLAEWIESMRLLPILSRTHVGFLTDGL
jgi:Transposase DDE domain group 1